MSTTVETITELQKTLRLQPQGDKQVAQSDSTSTAPIDPKDEDEYRYEHLLPHFSKDTYPPLEPFEHIDPGSRALSHPNPLAFLDHATKVADLTPKLGTEIHGVQLLKLGDDEKDELALVVIFTILIVLHGVT